MSIRNVFCALFLIAVTSYAYTGPRQTAAMFRPAVGAQAPNFKLRTAAGEEVELAAMKKKGPVVLLMLRGFPGYQCPYCTRQVGEFMSRIKDFQSAGANIIAVYPGPAEGLAEHAEDFVRGKTLPSNFYLVLDPDYSFTNMYGLRWDAPNETAYPATFLLDKKGIIRFEKISSSHGDRAGADSVLEALRAMQ
jgi:thioredoxin-dependent peroxiredoxin